MASVLIPFNGPIVTLAEARLAELTRFFTGIPCAAGHIAQRMVSNRACVICLAARTDARKRTPRVRERTKATRNARRAANIDIARAKGRAHYARDAAGNAKKMRDYRKQHPDRIKATKRRTYASHKTEIAARNRAWDRANPGLRQAQRDRDFAKNVVKRTEKRREWASLHPERRRAYHRKWRQAHPEAVRIQVANRRARILAVEGTITQADIDRIYLQQRGRCACCRKKVKRPEVHRDHVIALSRQGSNKPANIQITCASCNHAKGSRDALDFMRQKFGRLL